MNLLVIAGLGFVGYSLLRRNGAAHALKRTAASLARRASERLEDVQIPDPEARIDGRGVTDSRASNGAMSGPPRPHGDPMLTRSQ
jgi:hypothetical protein